MTQVIPKVQQVRAFATENTVRIRESGIRIGLGTDSMHGVIGYEMQWLVEHGWSTQEALVTATRHGGQLIDEPDVECWTRALGRISSVLRDRPFEDITVVCHIDAVYRAGQQVMTSSGAARAVTNRGGNRT